MGSGYRDESETLRARIDVLEGELADAKNTIARLNGTAVVARPASPLESDSAPSWLLGTASRLLVRRDVSGTADDKALYAIAQLLPARLGRYGQVTQVGRVLTYRVGTLELILTPTPTGTHLQLVVDSRGMMVLPFVGAMVLAFTVLPIVGSTLGPAALQLALPIAAVLGSFLGRAIFGRYLRSYQAKCRGAVEAVATIVGERPQANVRVAAEATRAADEQEDEDEVAALETRR